MGVFQAFFGLTNRFLQYLPTMSNPYRAALFGRTPQTVTKQPRGKAQKTNSVPFYSLQSYWIGIRCQRPKGKATDDTLPGFKPSFRNCLSRETVWAGGRLSQRPSGAIQCPLLGLTSHTLSRGSLTRTYSSTGPGRLGHNAPLPRRLRAAGRRGRRRSRTGTPPRFCPTW